MRTAASILALLTALLLLPAVPGVPTAEVDARLPLCDALVDVPGQGPSCPAGEGWSIPLADGTVLYTHGPDPLPPVTLPTLRTAMAGPAPSAPLVCVYDDAQPHVQLIYTHPPEFASRQDTLRASILAGVEQANGILLRDALRFGYDIRIKILCDANGDISFPAIQLPTSGNSDHFGSIVNDVRAVGHDNAMAKYWIVHDGRVDCGCGGQGNMWGDDSGNAANWNNKGGLYALSYYGNYGTTGGPTFSFSQVMLHEAGHTMGAVQYSAPHTTGAAHCIDGVDVMCYNDKGPQANQYRSTVCPGVMQFDTAWSWPFDCNFDDYFNPEPAPGSYLDTHWNLAAEYNSYLHRVKVN